MLMLFSINNAKKTISLNEKIANSGVYYASVRRFIFNADIKQISQQEKITLTVYYALPKNITFY